MNATEKNRAIITMVMAGLAKGDTQPFREVMTDDFVWRPMAVEGAWRAAVKGRAAVGAFFASLYEQFDGRQTTIPDHIFADGDTVIVEARGGGVMTKRGERYANNYCLVFCMADGRLVEVREYMDTALADARLDPLRISA